MSINSSAVGGRIKYKIVLLGDSKVGKTAIIERFINNRFEDTYNATIGIDFLIKNLTYQSKSYRLQLWDTAGQERFRSLITHYTKDSNLCVLVYDMNNLQSLQNIEKWMQLYNNHRESSAFSIIVGNKNDLQEKSCTDDIITKQLNKFPDINHFIVSAKTGKGISELFHSIIQLVNQKLGIVFKPLQIQQKPQNNENQVFEVNTAKTMVTASTTNTAALSSENNNQQQQALVKLNTEPKKRCFCC